MDKKEDCCDSSRKIQKLNNHQTKIYICPMHPQEEQDKPGICTICGMALESLMPVENEKDSELENLKKRFIFGLFFTIPLLFIEMGSHLFNIQIDISHKTMIWLQFFLATPVVIWSGLPLFSRGIQSFITKKLNMYSLISMGIGVAFTYSLIMLFFENFFISFFQAPIPIYFESSATITMIILLGQIMELKTRKQTRNAIKMLISLTPKTAHIIIDGKEKKVSIESIKIDDLIRIRPGEKVPVDGIVIDGESYIDESMITGESKPTKKIIDSSVMAGTMNKQGALIIKTKKIDANTILAQIISIVSRAEKSRPPIYKLVDRISSWFVPIVILIAIITTIVWTIFAPSNGLMLGIIAAISVLIIACPCALGLATPMSIMVGVGQAAKHGILIPNTESIQKLESIDTLVIDKTGTLTQGNPSLINIRTYNNNNEQNVLQIAASLEQNSEHHIGHAIKKEALKKELSLLKVSNFQSISGKGITGIINNQTIIIGNKAFMIEHNISIQSIPLEEIKTTYIFVAIDENVAGILEIDDPIKESAEKTIRLLQENGIDIIMLTGDNEKTANTIAQKLNIKKVYSEVLPEGKYNIIEKLQQNGKKVAMAGDGINDAPALVAADVGIAMGTGTDVAIESADIILVKGDLSKLVTLFRLSHLIMNNIRQNLFLAFGYNAASIPIAAGVLYPFFGILLSPVIASIAMSFSSVSIVANSLRLYLTRIKK